jgi:hypothetical protein
MIGLLLNHTAPAKGFVSGDRRGKSTLREPQTGRLKAVHQPALVSRLEPPSIEEETPRDIATTRAPERAPKGCTPTCAGVQALAAKS